MVGTDGVGPRNIGGIRTPLGMDEFVAGEALPLATIEKENCRGSLVSHCHVPEGAQVRRRVGWAHLRAHQRGTIRQM